MGAGSWLSITCFIWSFLYQQPLAADILRNHGFSTCLDDSDIRIEKLDFEFDRSSNHVVFDVAGTSDKEQNVTGSLLIKAYGQEFTRKFDPCEKDTFVEMLCPSR